MHQLVWATFATPSPHRLSSGAQGLARLFESTQWFTMAVAMAMILLMIAILWMSEPVGEHGQRCAVANTKLPIDAV